MNLLTMNLTASWKRSEVSSGGRPNTRQPSRLWLLLLAEAFLTGCAVGPDYKRPEAITIPTAYTGATNGWKVAEPRGQLPKGDWWEIFGDPELNTLEGQASTANQKLKAAVARFDEARAEMDVARAGLFPHVELPGSAIRQRVSPNAAGDRKSVV